MSYEEQTKMAYATDSISSSKVGRIERNSDELTISVELKQLEDVINQVESAGQDFVNRVMPVLFFGPEKACTANEVPCPPGSDLAQQLFRLRERLMGTANFLRIMGQKVNL